MNLKWLVLSVAISPLSIGFLHGQAFTELMLIPDSLLLDANEVIHQEDTEFKVLSSSSAIYKYHVRATILSSKSNIHEVLMHYDSYSKSKWIGGAVYDVDGNLIRKIKSKDLNDIAAKDGFSVFNDSRYYYVDMSNSRYPYTIEYSYERTFSSLRYYPDWHIQGYHQYVQNASFNLVIPEGLSFSSKAVNIDLKDKVESIGHKKTYTWRVENLAVVKSERMSGNTTENLPRLLIAPHLIDGKTWSGSMKDWHSFGKFLYQLNKGRDQLSPGMELQVRELIMNANSDQEKIQILYNYLKENMRYVSVQIGIGGWQSFDTHYVEQNKYGDCKALSNYMRAMLKVAEVPAHLVVISSGSDLEVDPNFVNPAFNHMILHIPSEDMFLECTSYSYPAGYIGWGNANRNGLAITPEGGQILKTPKMRAFENKLERSDTLKWTKSGEIKMIGRVTGYQQQHERFRRIETNQSTSEQEKLFLEDFPGAIKTIKSLAYASESEQPKACLNYDVTLLKIGSTSGDRIFLPAVPLESFNNPLQKMEQRDNKIERKYAYSDHTEFIIQLPNGYGVESMPKNQKMEKGPFGHFSVEFIKANNALTVKRDLTIRPVQLAAEEYQQLYDWYQAIENMDSQKVVLKKMPNRT